MTHEEVKQILSLQEAQIMTIEEMRNRLDKYCKGFELCIDGCPLLDPSDGSCRWIELSDESTEDCYHLLIAEGLIGKSEQPEINFVKVERNDGFMNTAGAETMQIDDYFKKLIKKMPKGIIKEEAKQVMTDAVQHPSHYTHGGIECIDAIKASMTADGFCDFCKGNIIKYIWRWRDKGGVEDLRKASVYLGWLISAADVKEKK